MEPKIKILIVEDEALIAENLRFTLEDLGYEVTDTCYTFSEAKQAIESNLADLAMLDINLGSNEAENGLTLGGMMREHGNKPFIFLTAYSDADTISKATKLKPAGYLVKPVNAATVFASIQLAMERHEQQIPLLAAVDEASKPDFFFVKMGTRTHKVMWKEVQTMEAGKNYVRLKNRDGREYPIRGTLTFVTEQLVPPAMQSLFLRVNRSAIVNKKAITAYDDEAVYCGAERIENNRVGLKELREMMAGII